MPRREAGVALLPDGHAALPRVRRVGYASRVRTGSEAGLLTTGEMARRSNNTLRAVRFYEEEGILRPAKRTDGGHRLFDESELDRLMLVSDLRSLGLSLDEIKAVLDLKRAGATPAEASKEALSVISRRLDELKGRLASLTRLRDDLERTADVMSACVHCKDAAFPSGCAKCATVGDTRDLPRGMRVLWSCGEGNARS